MPAAPDPIKHVHQNTEDCNKEMIAFLKKSLEDKKEKGIDPRWEILNKLKNK